MREVKMTVRARLMVETVLRQVRTDGSNLEQRATNASLFKKVCIPKEDRAQYLLNLGLGEERFLDARIDSAEDTVVALEEAEVRRLQSVMQSMKITPADDLEWYGQLEEELGRATPVSRKKNKQE